MASADRDLPDTERGLSGALALLAIAAFAALALRTAWLCDDAYITFRSVENLATGNGPRWNLDERVQAFTHPLWMLLLTAGRLATGEVYGSALALSVVLSTLAFALVVRSGARTPWGALVGAAALIGSKAFVDYSTSGLEGPLVHALLALLAISYASAPGAGRAFQLALAAGLLLATRPDLAPLMAPVAAAGLWPERRHLGSIAAGLAPLAAWLAFSLLYFGFPFPNTAYAKLSTGLPRAMLFEQGLHYLRSTLLLDPLSLLALAGATVLAFWRRERLSLLLAAGMLLQLGYVVWVGGDFMSGRFLTPPLLFAALILARSAVRPPEALALGGLLLLVALAAPRSPLRAPTAYGAYLDGSRPHDHIDARGITDERAYWYHYTGLFSPNARSGTHVRRGHPFAEQLRAGGPGVHVVNGMGFVGYFAGPEPHLLDPMGLTDPLLARLPVFAGGWLAEQDAPDHMAIPWRIGHFVREVPAGYVATLETRENRIESPALAEYWDALERVTRAPLFAPSRLATILRMNLGGYDRLLERHLAEVAPPDANGAGEPGNASEPGADPEPGP